LELEGRIAFEAIARIRMWLFNNVTSSAISPWGTGFLIKWNDHENNSWYIIKTTAEETVKRRNNKTKIALHTDIKVQTDQMIGKVAPTKCSQRNDLHLARGPETSQDTCLRTVTA